MNKRLSEINPPITGSTLLACLNAPDEPRHTIAEQFIYEHTTLMITSKPGIGKSILALQAAVELSSGLPVFGYFQVPRPFKVLYVQCERHESEIIERLKTIKQTININENNLVITNAYQRLNLIDYHDTLLFIDAIKRDCPRS